MYPLKKTLFCSQKAHTLKTFATGLRWQNYFTFSPPHFAQHTMASTLQICLLRYASCQWDFEFRLQISLTQFSSVTFWLCFSSNTFRTQHRATCQYVLTWEDCIITAVGRRPNTNLEPSSQAFSLSIFWLHTVCKNWGRRPGNDYTLSDIKN